MLRLHLTSGISLEDGVQTEYEYTVLYTHRAILAVLAQIKALKVSA